MKKFIKIFYKHILVAILIVLTIMFGGVHIYNNYKQKLAVENAVLADLRSSVADSVKTIMYKQKVAEIEAAKASEREKTIIASNNAKYWHQLATRYKISSISSNQKADSLAKTKPECDELKVAYVEAIDSLNKAYGALEIENAELGIEAEGYSRQLYLTEQQLQITNDVVRSKDSLILIKNNLIELQASRLKKNNNWLSKSKFWIGYGLGFASGVGVLVVSK